LGLYPLDRCIHGQRNAPTGRREEIRPGARSDVSLRRVADPTLDKLPRSQKFLLGDRIKKRPSLNGNAAVM
jgi:hypothetical protein